jgi:antitoxin PrlF
MDDDFFDEMGESDEGCIPVGQNNYRTAEETQEYLRTTPAFLNLLGADIEKNPNRLQPVTSELLDRINALVGDDDIDLDAPLLSEDDD